jgi:hypothetical protein
VITHIGPVQGDYSNQMITISSYFHLVIFSKLDVLKEAADNINELLQLSALIHYNINYKN